MATYKARQARQRKSFPQLPAIRHQEDRTFCKWGFISILFSLTSVDRFPPGRPADQSDV
jgi:hypothetical protein